jgi:hypothetical protein
MFGRGRGRGARRAASQSSLGANPRYALSMAPQPSSSIHRIRLARQCPCSSKWLAAHRAGHSVVARASQRASIAQACPQSLGSPLSAEAWAAIPGLGTGSVRRAGGPLSAGGAASGAAASGAVCMQQEAASMPATAARTQCGFAPRLIVDNTPSQERPVKPAEQGAQRGEPAIGESLGRGVPCMQMCSIGVWAPNVISSALAGVR